MHFTRYAVGAAAAFLAVAPPLASAQSAGDLKSLRQDMETLRRDYQAKIADLEGRLAKAEADAAAARKEADQANQTAGATSKTVEVLASEPAAPPAAPPTASSANAFNPGVAAVLNGFGVAARNDPTTGRISGVAAGDGAGGPPRGFSIGESEISFAANIDPTFTGFLNLSFDNANKLSVEEAYVRTTNLPDGLTIKAGRFYSGIGYINERHSHDWSFSDAPLPYKAFLNSQFGDDGVQVRWLVPTDQFLELGGEVFRGEAYPAAGDANHGLGAYSLFVHTGADINASSSYLAALSYLHTQAVGRATGADLFSGDTDVGIASLIYKWAPNGNPTTRNLVLSSELFYGREKGAFDLSPLSQTHFGWYAQGVYQFMPSWSVGLRFAGLNSEFPGAPLARSALDELGHSPFAATALLEYDTSEFGRIRLQYTRDEAAAKANDELVLQYTVIYGPHGAHRY